MTTPTMPMPEPNDGRLAEEAERWLAEQTADALDDKPGTSPRSPGRGLRAQPLGHTRATERLEADLAEARRLRGLLAEGDPREDLPTRRELRASRRAAEAHRLLASESSPALVARRDQKVRRVLTVMNLVAAVIALGVSAVGVQDSVTAALGIDQQDDAVAWWAAFLYEPVMSLPLLAVVGVQAYAALRGRVVDRRSRQGKQMLLTELVLLGLTLMLQCWPALPWVVEEFDALPLLVHALGPVCAVVAVWTLPLVWSVMAALPVPSPTNRPDASSGPVNLRKHSPESAEDADLPDDVRKVRDHTRAAIDGGHLAPDPTGYAIYRHVMGSKGDRKRAYRVADLLHGYRPSGSA